MSSPNKSGPPEQGGADPWAAFGYLVAGVAFYGALGWGLGRWLNAPYLTPLGILVGIAFGMYLVFHEYLKSVPTDTPAPAPRSTKRTADNSEADATWPDDDD
ncbi:MAG: AtpZ/AtpI family protein [Pseudonocardiales bacterium]|nr:AtpZ/AtpI family protein [Jatrophihabitantaceae bacterium]MCW2603661.1 AtpZ/AtpI family protein [Pseudonocardiales bacterium]